MFNYLQSLPAQKVLKQIFVDSHTTDFSQTDLNCVARMILAIDQPEELAQIALGHLVLQLGACSADIGFLGPQDKVYQPTFVYAGKFSQRLHADGVLTWSNQDSLFQQAWKNRHPVSCCNIYEDTRISDSRAAFSAIHSESTLLQRLTIGRQTVGLVCVDFTNEQHEWSPEESYFIQRFAETFFAPLIAISQHWYGGKSLLTFMKRPTQSELAAIKLAAKGMRYKQIAWELGKSVRTIENQLRHARNTMSACNQVDLVKKCQPFLDS